MLIRDLILMIGKINNYIFLWPECRSICLQNYMTIWPKLKIFYNAVYPNLEIAGKFASNTV
jgi:hypothetical protein